MGNLAQWAAELWPAAPPPGPATPPPEAAPIQPDPVPVTAPAAEPNAWGLTPEDKAEGLRRLAERPAALPGRQRHPSWPDAADVPQPGDWCGCCSRFDRKGGRWWCEVTTPTGWCCATCHPGDHLPEAERREVRT